MVGSDCLHCEQISGLREMWLKADNFSGPLWVRLPTRQLPPLRLFPIFLPLRLFCRAPFLLRRMPLHLFSCLAPYFLAPEKDRSIAAHATIVIDVFLVS